MKILVVEDEIAMAAGLKFNFEQEGYEVTVVHDGLTALEFYQKETHPFDLVVLDLMLPSKSGYETCQELRKIDASVPVLVLSARTLSDDKAQAFDCGSDQYMTKPFALPELLARVRNLLERRSSAVQSEGSSQEASTPQEYQFGNVHVDFRRFEVRIDEELHQLTTIEMQLLRYFIENEGNVLSRFDILENVWKEPGGITTRSIDNFVLRLRKIIEPNPSQPQHLVSIRGTGYRFIAKPEQNQTPD